MTSVVLTLLSLLGLAGVGFIRHWQANREGRKDQRLDAAEKTLDRIKEAKNAASRARSDSDISDRLRERYDIDE